MYISSNSVGARLVSSIVALAMITTIVLPGFVAFADETGSTPPVQSQDQSPPSNDPQAGGEGQPGQTDPGPSTDPANPPSGENGDNGQNAGDSDHNGNGQPSDTPATVDTGNAGASTNVSNSENTNTVQTSPGGNTTLDAENGGDLGNTATSSAQTGQNGANGGAGNAVISTGNGLAEANVINVVNTNIIDSTGLLLFLNMIMGGTLDLRTFDLSYFFGGASAEGGCSLFGCDNGTLNVNGTNDANVANDVIVRSQSGGNSATSTEDGNASINTGNAYAAANVLNMLNSNFINSNYLLVSMNNFGDLGNDIVLPNADFFQRLLTGGSSPFSSIHLNASNTAQATTTIDTTASSGNNTATTTGEGSGSIDTGKAYAGSNTYNQINTTEVGGAKIFLLFRVWGNWTGAIQGLPPGISWKQTPLGIQLVNDNGTGSPEATLFGEGGGACCGGNTQLNVNATNTAALANNIKVWALTGDNKTLTEDGDGKIKTGNAYASANAVNFVNTNVIGRNWIFAIFNIFGNWSGNIAFGRPDLWIGAVVEQRTNPAVAGDPVTYHFTVSNRGDIDATHVYVNANFPRGTLIFDGAEETDRGVRWDIGTVRRGETRDVRFEGRIGDVPGGETPIPMDATVSAQESDNNPSDNKEQVNIVATRTSVAVTGIGGVGVYTNDPNLLMTKTTDTVSTTTPAAVNYQIVIKNTGGPAYKTVLSDSMKQPSGAEVYGRSWKLGTIREGEEIKLSYTVQFDGELPDGVYSNRATLTGRRNNPDDRYAVDMPTVEASAQVQVTAGAPVPKVLGASTTNPQAADAPICVPMIRSYLKEGKDNSYSDVANLQIFLNTYQGEHLTLNGTYDATTSEAVKRFQEKYKDDVLTPWGISKPTGYVYYTTQRLVNELWCKGEKTFTLDPQQINEIARFRASIKAAGQEPIAPEVGSKGDRKPDRGVAAPKPTKPETTQIELPKPKSSQVQFPKPEAIDSLKVNTLGTGLINGLNSWIHGLVPFADALES